MEMESVGDVERLLLVILRLNLWVLTLLMTQKLNLSVVNWILNLLSSPVNAATNEVTTLQTTRANLAAKKAAFLEAATAKAALLSNSSLKTAPTVSSPTRH